MISAGMDLGRVRTSSEARAKGLKEKPRAVMRSRCVSYAANVTA
jgi:hypothetical protein